jgi:hypothetical protein
MREGRQEQVYELRCLPELCAGTCRQDVQCSVLLVVNICLGSIAEVFPTFPSLLLGVLVSRVCSLQSYKQLLFVSLANRFYNPFNCQKFTNFFTLNVGDSRNQFRRNSHRSQPALQEIRIKLSQTMQD